MGKKFRILLLNGPNLNLLGSRESHIYGNVTLINLVKNLTALSNSLDISLVHFQSNAEHELINQMHETYNHTDFIIINPAAFTHTSIAMRDALLAISIPFIEVHLSNIYTRESFRHNSYFSDIAVGVICGFGIKGYFFAIKMANEYLSISD
ncbi:type II 3-dehydroquinate dehydratase [Blochmannia endosymbiont of Colobopsis nipponica]|uniref:type II 3-dehydroquinate dehydratase n=1 Tax=Blochmannia endosymbiont of Colobopsis nipponica TaxID=2681987 RepID=UPI0017818E6A|nr:type II 3-dehydroquinate dehydratase [Blochmannia endosymbiont of Colobopsis nipponica]QOI11145.1 type II 3-dehydroquinate dehydratase [Blochmannia endosymbiont of Colobopsis nipponica]